MMNERHRRKRLAAWRYVLAWPRSVWCNFRLLPWRQAVRLPILVSHRTVLENLQGGVEIVEGRLKTGLVKIGFNTCQCSDFRYDRTRLNIRGKVRFGGACAIGAGTCIEVGEGAELVLGANASIGPKSLIICHKKITFGTDMLTSWCCTFMDTDQHELCDEAGTRVNPDRPVTVGDGVWCGCHATVSKGVWLAEGTVVGAGSRLVGEYREPYTVVGGNPARVVRKGVRRTGIASQD